MRHLAGDGALPDQLVEPGLVLAQVRLDLLGQVADGGGPDRLMRLLGVLGLGLEDARLRGQVVGAIALGDVVAQLRQGLLGQVDRVGSHVGDQADRAAADVDALVELLGGAHGALGGEAELARGLLLQRRGDERRRRVALALLALDRSTLSLPRRGDQRLLDDAGPSSSVMLNCSIFSPSNSISLALNGFLSASSGPGIGLDGPVLAPLEGLDLQLALDDQAQRRALHAPGGEPAADLLPQQRRQVEADQIVQRPRACWALTRSWTARGDWPRRLAPRAW
jgi:hypothetical protein